jgi:hypothetical protein
MMRKTQPPFIFAAVYDEIATRWWFVIWVVVSIK